MEAPAQTPPPGPPILVNTPLARRKRSALENQRAEYEHKMSTKSIEAVIDPSYVVDALAPLNQPSKFKGSKAPQNTPDSVLESIKNTPSVQKALKALPDSQIEDDNCAPTVHLLNCISAAYYDHSPTLTRGSPVIIFGYRPSISPDGDYLALQFKPDYYAYVGNITKLRQICRGIAMPEPKPNSEMTDIGEHKRKLKARSADGQLKSYVSAHKRYRPDLPTVHAFCIEKGCLTLSSLNPCGMSVSEATPCSDLDTWIAHVALVYRAHAERDMDIQYCSEQQDFYRWDVRSDDGEGLAVSPFYVSHPLGRTTFACFDVLPLPDAGKRTSRASQRALLDEMSEQFHNRPVTGFWKMSWQTVSSRPNELELLSDLHKDGWIPGLVRPYDFQSSPVEQGGAASGQTPGVTLADGPHAETIPDQMQVDAVADNAEVDTASANPPVNATTEQTPASDGVTAAERVAGAIYHPAKLDGVGRVKEVLHLGSIGQPLSQCETTGELVAVLYDLIETHAHMCERKVLHRDISWYNVFCKGRHIVQEHPVTGENTVLPRPCFDSIRGIPDAEPRVLLADLDHSVKISEQTIPQLAEKTGTPMFIAMEMSNPEGIRWDDHFLFKIKTWLTRVEKYPAELARAFPEGTGDFMARFERVIDAENRRQAESDKCSAPPPPEMRHNRRHDVESMYWVFLWAFSRAKPLASSPAEDNPAMMDGFCKAMFSHTIGGETGEAERHGFITKNDACDNLFHPKLKPLETLFNYMAAYLSIPWYLYCGETATNRIMEDDHAHIALRRIVLGFALDPENREALQIVLDTELPRYTRALESFTRATIMTTTKRAHTGATGTAGSKAQGSSSSRKRKASARPLPPRKRKPSQLATEGDDLDVDYEDDEIDANGDDAAPGDTNADAPAPSDPHPGTNAAPQDDCTDGPVLQYVAKEHQFATSADALRLMFWKDRSLWFGPGIDPNPKPKTNGGAS